MSLCFPLFFCVFVWFLCLFDESFWTSGELFFLQEVMQHGSHTVGSCIRPGCMFDTLLILWGSNIVVLNKC